MKVSKIRQITAWLEASNIEHFEFSSNGETVRLTLAENGHENGHVGDQAAVPAQESTHSQAHADSDRTAAVALSVGIFLSTHPLRSLPFAQVGDVVEKGNILGLLKIGQMYAPVTAPQGGVVQQILVENQTMVDYGTRLIALRATTGS